MLFWGSPHWLRAAVHRELLSEGIVLLVVQGLQWVLDLQQVVVQEEFQGLPSHREASEVWFPSCGRSDSWQLLTR